MTARYATMTCRCGVSIVWRSDTLDAVLLRPQGWGYDAANHILCPECAAMASQNSPAAASGTLLEEAADGRIPAS